MGNWSLAQRHAQLEVLMKVESELQQIKQETKKEFQNVSKLLDELKPPPLKNKHKNNSQNHRRDSDESISSIDSINDTVLVTNKYDKVLVFDKARTSSNLTDNSKKSADPSKKMALASSNSTGHSDKSTSQSKKKMVASSNTTDSDESAGPSKKMALASSNSTGHSDNSAGPSKKTAVAKSNTTDSDKTAGPSKKMALASSNSTRHSDKSSDKENQTNNNTLQLNERILHPVAAPVAQEKEGHVDLVPIGSGRTLVRRDKYRMVNWKSYSTATRSLLRAVFSRAVLSTHSLSGKRSLDFPNRPARMCLDEQKVRDIIIAVREKFEVNENIIRNIITKCADESKMMKMRQMKQEENEQKWLRLQQLFYSNYLSTI